jgi:hypothetical protein
MSRKTGKPGHCARKTTATALLASPVLCLRFMAAFLAPVALPVVLAPASGCLDPFLTLEKESTDNHAPVMSSIVPAQSFTPIRADIGVGCRPAAFSFNVDDADDDVLTVRFYLLFEREGETRAQLAELERAPSDDLPDGRRYAPVTFDLLRQFGLVAGADVLQNDPVQLLEVRVSDGPFATGTLDTPAREGGVIVDDYWVVSLVNEECLP